ncbi:DUF3160 domain-containing protein [Candidatus Poribacteria bacterium]|nr:DUF3160 domain-containing protein [Candidatus Poribacteria bacterium]
MGFLNAAVILLYCLVNINSPVQTDFGLYEPYQADVSPSISTYPISGGLENVVNASQFKLTSSQKERISREGFIAIPSDMEQIFEIYKLLAERGQPIFVTTDSVLHAFHILYDYALRVMEFERFYSDLDLLISEMLNRSIDEYNASAGKLAKEAALRNIAFFDVAERLMGRSEEIPSEARKLSDAELRLIESHSGISPSPIFGYMEDYSQYIPRGHYTRNDKFKRFFKAMMWFGRMGFRLKSESETLSAILIAAALQGETDDGRQLMDLWDEIYEPTVFFVGKSDDLTVRHYMSVARKVYGPSFDKLSPDQMAEGLNRFIEEAQNLEDPLINSSIILQGSDLAAETKGFRFMGQRFIPDSYMFTQLVHSHVQNRLLPKGLDVMAVLGSDRAYEILTGFYNEDRFPGYVQQIERLRSEYANLPSEVWAQNLYWNWLYCLMPLLERKDEGYPTFMRSDAWTDKELITALGSWAELRHDTILYAKQSYTKITAVPPRPELKVGYVEPNPKLYARLASLARFMRRGLEERGLLLDEFDWKLRDLEELLLKLKGISEKELRGEKLSEEDFELIFEYGKKLEALNTFTSIDQAIENEEDKSMALVADVHTDPNTGRALEVAVGRPMWLYVVAPINGQLWLTVGAMFSYYEFTQPISRRLTDGEWQEMLRSGQAPRQPEWTSSFLLSSLTDIPSERCDLNGDGAVDVLDLVSVAKAYGRGGDESGKCDVNGDGTVDILDLVLVSRAINLRWAGAMVERIIAGKPTLLPNYPNPFNPETWIPFWLPKDGEVEIRIYDITGHLIRNIDLGRKHAGLYMSVGKAARWDGRDNTGQPVSSGIYFCELRACGGVDIRKMILAK